MQKTFLSLVLIGLLLLCFSQSNQSNEALRHLNVYKIADKNFLQAEMLSLQAGDNEEMQSTAEKTYLKALRQFSNLIPSVEKAGNDSLAFFIRIKTGFIHYYFDSSNAAKTDYLKAIALKQNLSSVADSFLFLPFLYTGGIYYSQQLFDSALLYYKKAELLNDKYKNPLEESERLYNRLGAMYYEMGNYRLARNYFEKAISLTSPAQKGLLTNYKINIASLLIKLEELDEAKTVYNSLLPSPVFENEIYHNLAIISIKQHDYKKAIGYLRKINYADNKKSIDLYYNFCVAYSSLNEADSAEFYFQKSLTENAKWNGQQKNIQYGLILKYKGDKFAKQHQYKEATSQYQQAIVQFQNDFKETESQKNPEQFSGIFSFINLFNTLAAKAAAFEAWYQQKKDIELLKVSLQTYHSAFKLAGYVEKTYNSDEARLFLGKLKYIVHSKPIDVSLLLYNLTQKRNYLEDAYRFDQLNKASILAFNVQENDLRSTINEANELLHKESSLKTAITRLLLKASQVTDTIKLFEINTAIRDNEIELGKLQDQLNDDPDWQQKKSLEQIPTVNQLQKRLDKNTAILSYHISENELLTLLITQGRFEYKKTVINKNFFSAIESFKTSLHNTSADQRYNGANAANSLYEQLITPILSWLLQTKRLIIIPDDELNYLPFEALQDENKKYLIERFSFQYQYSTALLSEKEEKIYAPGTLSFAPFSSKSHRDSSGYSLSRLPASKDEVIHLEGISFTDTNATKNNFLQSINKYGTLHLATHASVNNENQSRSFIAFYPGNNDYKLYAGEIANLNLVSTKLTILSACETGTGKLVKGEGLMSLSRAFAYAGCPNIISSLWKAEDKTTAFITQQLHYYLNKKYTNDKALQQAKLDLLNNKDIDPRFKSPNYWAHLIFIGDYDTRRNLSNWWRISIVILVTAVVYTLIKRKSLFARNKQA